MGPRCREGEGEVLGVAVVIGWRSTTPYFPIQLGLDKFGN
jgi:hypothetical protein